MKDPLLSKITPLTRRQFSFALGGLVGYMMGCSPQNPSSDSPATTDTRFITHSLGTTEVPRDPQRIIALSGTADLESLLALGIQPIAAAGDDRGGGLTVWQPHLQPLMRDIEMLPSRRNISLETVTLLRPDLILGTIGHVRPIYEQLSKIAPTIALDTAQQIWDESFRLVAQCLNLELAAEVVIQEVQNKSQEVAQQYHDSVMGKTFACIQDGLDNNQVWVYHDTNAVRFLKQVGLTPSVTPADVSSEDPVGFYISRERLDLIDADVIVAHSYAHESVTQSSVLLEDPLFQRLRAAQKGLVFTIPSPYWYLGGAIGIPLILQDLDTVILPRLIESY